MKDYEKLTNKSIETLIDRGMDFLINEAKTFVKDNNLHELSKSQIYGLSNQVVKGKNYDDLKDKVRSWLDNQSKKKTGEKWKNIKDEFLKRMFEWDNDRLKNINSLTKELLPKTKPFEDAIDNLLDKQNLPEDLNFKLANNFFTAVLSCYRCYWDELKYAVRNKDYSRLKFYIPGTSLRGVIRSHAEKIVRTLWDDIEDPICCDPFGKNSCSNRISSAKNSYKFSCLICKLFGNTHTASRIHVHDSDFMTGIKEIDMRDGIAIDRFTKTIFWKVHSIVKLVSAISNFGS